MCADTEVKKWGNTLLQLAWLRLFSLWGEIYVKDSTVTDTVGHDYGRGHHCDSFKTCETFFVWNLHPSYIRFARFLACVMKRPCIKYKEGGLNDSYYCFCNFFRLSCGLLLYKMFSDRPSFLTLPWLIAKGFRHTAAHKRGLICMKLEHYCECEKFGPNVHINKQILV